MSGATAVNVTQGTLILSAANTYTGPTDVQAGTLAVTGSTVSVTTVEFGATIGGSGAIGSLNAMSGAEGGACGILTPYSTLTVNGTASFASGSTFAVNINAAGQNDKLAVTGATTIAGGAVQVSAALGRLRALDALHSGHGDGRRFGDIRVAFDHHQSRLPLAGAEL